MENKKECRVPFQVKLLESNYFKIKKESKKLGLTMSAFLSILVARYEGMDIKIDNPEKNINNK